MCHLTLQNIFERTKFVGGSIFAVRSKIFFSLLWGTNFRQLVVRGDYVLRRRKSFPRRVAQSCCAI
jgi:hypothetical protein